jgi:hypothetical protein
MTGCPSTASRPPAVEWTSEPHGILNYNAARLYKTIAPAQKLIETSGSHGIPLHGRSRRWTLLANIIQSRFTLAHEY